MKKRFKMVVFLSLVMVLFLVPIVMADTVYVQRYNGYYGGSGGEFNLTPSEGLSWVLKYYSTEAKVGSGFESFCLETDEYVNLPGTYNAVVNPNNMAVQGGSNTNAGDIISKGTAYLYSQFAAGALKGYDYTPGSDREASAMALQKAIWYLEGETNPGYGEENHFTTLAAGEFDTLAKAMENYNGGYGVGVLNLTYTGGGFAQDQLVMVPEPGILFLIGTGFFSIAAYRKKIVKK